MVKTTKSNRGRPSKQAIAERRADSVAEIAPVSMKVPKRLGNEIGRTGLIQSAGYVQEEFVRELQGQLGMKRYREIRDNWSLVNGILKVIKYTCLQVDVRVEPYSEKGPDGKTKEAKREDVENADFVKECLEDMSLSWQDTLSEILSMIVFGFAPMEVVYKKREGWSVDAPGDSSRFSDGRIGWRKMAIRSQESIQKWEFDPEGGVLGLWQIAAPMYQMVFIPIEKLLLFRTESNKGNPEGMSWLRGVYFDWYAYKRLVELAAIRVERDATGIPVAEIPSRSMNNPAVKAAWQNIVENIRLNEQAGVLYGQEYDPETKQPMVKLSLLGSPGALTTDPNIQIQRHQTSAAIALLADFMLLGHEKSGSWALADNKTGVFAKAVGGLLDSIFDTLNRHALPRLWALNGLPMDRMPQIKHGDLEARDFQAIADYLSKLSSSGLVLPHKQLEDTLMEAANLPIRPEDEGDTGMSMPTRPGEEDEEKDEDEDAKGKTKPKAPPKPEAEEE